MRLYLSGKITSGEASHLLPIDIFFANSNCDDNTVASENCLMLSGIECECSTHGNEWSARWKEVRAEFEEDMDENIKSEWILNTIHENNLKLSNMNAYVDIDPSIVTVEEVMLLDGAWGTEVYLDKNLFSEEITFEGFDCEDPCAIDSKWKRIHCRGNDVVAWITNAVNEAGNVIASLDPSEKEVAYLDEDARHDPYAQKVIREMLVHGYASGEYR